MNTQICEAIKARAVVNFYYDGGMRIVEPHCHGISKDNNELLRGYQTEGYSQSGNPVGWKLFSVGKISSLKQPIKHSVATVRITIPMIGL
jgi:hypothetical protein